MAQGAIDIASKLFVKDCVNKMSIQSEGQWHESNHAVPSTPVVPHWCVLPVCMRGMLLKHPVHEWGLHLLTKPSVM